ncbi:YopX family protein [Streptococcus suis]|uniref:YopX family protein n=1 Tax=Streptococcus suis TaxID=1307 RepID=UPI002FC86055
MVVPKFRAFYEGKMYGVKAVIWTSRGLYVTLDEGNKAGRRVRGAKLMQSTGAFDKNGKEIFEGDVVVIYDELNEFESEVYEIVYSQDNLAWIFYDNESHDFYLILTCTWDELEIIGNAHQNPELLEVNND